jgi:hypothetical protein
MRMRTRVIRTIGAALLAAPLALAAVAGPAGAGVEIPLEGICGMSPSPGDADGLIAAPTSLFVGIGVFNVTGEDQTAAAEVFAGEKARFFVEYDNTDSVTHDIVVRADLDGTSPPPGYSIKVLRSSNGKDVTDKVFGLAGLRLRHVAAGGTTPDLIFRVKLQPSASGEVLAAFVTGNYETASACGDTVGLEAGDIDV